MYYTSSQRRFHTFGISFPCVFPFGLTMPSTFILCNQDDASALDLLTLKKWSLIFRVFIAEYLHLEPNTNASSSRDPADLVRSTKSRETQPLITYLVAVLNSIFHLLYHLLFAIRKTDDAK